MIKRLSSAAVIVLCAVAPAQAVDVAVGARLSTLGPGLEVATGITPWLNVRGVINGFNYSKDYTDDEDNEYNGKLKLFTTGALVDLHPFSGVFRITTGGLYNGFALKGKTKNEQSFEFETDDFIYEGTGSADAKVDFPTFAPYLGLGWGRPIKPDGNFWFSFDVGVMLQGSLNADLNIRGIGDIKDKQGNTVEEDVVFEDQQIVKDDIAKYEGELEDEAKDFKYYPVIGLGFGYKF